MIDPEAERVLAALASSPTPECMTCGFPVLRPDTHAVWCARWNSRESALRESDFLVDGVDTRPAVAAALDAIVDHYWRNGTHQ